MKVKLTLNGKINFILIPETTTEESLLKDAAKGNFDAHLLTQSTAILDEVIPEGTLIIKSMINKTN